MLLNSFTLSLINSYKLNVDFHKNYTTQQKNDDFSTYLIGLYLVQPVDTGEIADFITRFKMEPVRFAVAEITKQLTSYSNDDIISDEIKINLTWPIVRSYGSLRIPVRGVKWEHLDTFDLFNFLRMNAKFKAFKCPYWNKNSNQLKVSTFTLALLQKMIALNRDNPKEVTSVIIKKDSNSQNDPETGIDMNIQFEKLSTVVTKQDMYDLIIYYMGPKTHDIIQVSAITWLYSLHTPR